jgi:nucleotide-binding universal stress UspA family protein
VPTDFSEFSDRALRQALDIAKQYGAKVYVLHVLHEETYYINEFSSVAGALQKIEDRKLSAAEENLQKQLDNFSQAKEVQIETNFRKGISYDEILKEAKEKEIDLIVIASLGRSGIAKYLIGSVARNVLKGAQCPVLLTK